MRDFKEKYQSNLLQSYKVYQDAFKKISSLDSLKQEDELIETERKAFNEISKIIGIDLDQFAEILGDSGYFDNSFSVIFNTKQEIVFEEFEKEIEEIYVDIVKIFDIQKILLFVHKNSAMGG